MLHSVYESVNSDRSFPVKAFVASIDNISFHWHREYEILVLISGTMQVRINSIQKTLEENDILLINSNDIHALSKVGDSNAICMVIQIAPEMFLQEGREVVFYLDSTNEDVPSCGYYHFITLIARIIYGITYEEKHTSIRFRSRVCNMISDLYDYVTYDIRYRDEFTRSGQEQIIDMIHYLENHISQDDVLDTACRNFGMSRKTMDRSFKQNLGEPAKPVLDELRLEKAKKLLKDTNQPMPFIWEACGFGSEKTFYRSFKDALGITPNEYRVREIAPKMDLGSRGYLDFDQIQVRKLLLNLIMEA